MSAPEAKVEDEISPRTKLEAHETFDTEQDLQRLQNLIQAAPEYWSGVRKIVLPGLEQRKDFPRAEKSGGWKDSSFSAASNIPGAHPHSERAFSVPISPHRKPFKPVTEQTASEVYTYVLQLGQEIKDLKGRDMINLHRDVSRLKNEDVAELRSEIKHLKYKVATYSQRLSSLDVQRAWDDQLAAKLRERWFGALRSWIEGHVRKLRKFLVDRFVWPWAVPFLVAGIIMAYLADVYRRHLERSMYYRYHPFAL